MRPPHKAVTLLRKVGMRSITLKGYDRHVYKLVELSGMMSGGAVPSASGILV